MENHLVELIFALALIGLTGFCAIVYRRSGDALSTSNTTALKVEYLKADMTAMEQKMTSFEATAGQINQRLATLEAYGKTQSSSLKRLEAHLIRRQHSGGPDEDSDN